MQNQNKQINILLKKFSNFLKKNVPAGKTLVLPFSGGLDSVALLAMLCAAYDKNKIFIFHASLKHNKQETKHAQLIAKKFGVRIHSFNLQKLKNEHDLTIAKILKTKKATDEYYMGNLLYALARGITRQKNGILLGTLDLTELLTGYYTKDSFSGDLLPIGGLSRSELKQIAKHLGVTSFLPEGWGPFSGNGNLVKDINKSLEKLGKNLDFADEDVLEEEVYKCMYLSKDKKKDLRQFLKNNRHKSKPIFLGKPIFYPNKKTENYALSFIKK